jgi:hypothetical protein
VALAGLVASLAVLHVTTYLAGGRPATMGGTLTVSLDGHIRRRSWPTHPGCGCRFEHLTEGQASNSETTKED